jgi:acetyltransferase-like isoleucine patch superfamily enzyme
MFFKIYIAFRRHMPKVRGMLFKWLMSNKKLRIGQNFQCDSWPQVLITDNGKVNIGDNVYFRKDIELRAHGNATVDIQGNNRIDKGVRILAANDSSLVIGNRTRIGLHSVFNGGDDIHIGEGVLISGFVYLQTSNHSYAKSGDIQKQGYIHKPIKLGDDCWLAAHVVVLPGVTINDGAIIGSNAVVTKDVEANTINGGIPSKLIKNRYE